MDSLAAALSSVALIGLAEMGDKSQIVCMTLAARHRHWPVLLGASSAFLGLNALAVVFGAGLAHWIPEPVVAGVVAVLFAAFGVHALLRPVDDDCEEVAVAGRHGVFLMAFGFIFLAEFGDKTQLAVAGLAGQLDPWAVWVGASVALVGVSALGVWAGSTLLRRLPRQTLQRASGWLFIAFALLAAWRIVA